MNRPSKGQLVAITLHGKRELYEVLENSAGYVAKFEDDDTPKRPFLVLTRLRDGAITCAADDAGEPVCNAQYVVRAADHDVPRCALPLDHRDDHEADSGAKWANVSAAYGGAHEEEDDDARELLRYALGALSDFDKAALRARDVIDAISALLEGRPWKNYRPSPDLVRPAYDEGLRAVGACGILFGADRIACRMRLGHEENFHRGVAS